jgi:ubiquinone biosynthesis protein UbiJ
MGTKINVSLGVTLCTNPDLRNFIRVGIDAQGIDLDGDVEAQARAAMLAAITVVKVLDEGLEEAVSEIIAEEGNPNLLKETLAKHGETIEKLKSAFFRVADRVKTLEQGPAKANTMVSEGANGPAV